MANTQNTDRKEYWDLHLSALPFRTFLECIEEDDYTNVPLIEYELPPWDTWLNMLLAYLRKAGIEDNCKELARNTGEILTLLQYVYVNSHLIIGCGDLEPKVKGELLGLDEIQYQLIQPVKQFPYRQVLSAIQGAHRLFPAHYTVEDIITEITTGEFLEYKNSLRS